jgi:hypothetical protein
MCGFSREIVRPRLCSLLAAQTDLLVHFREFFSNRVRAAKKASMQSYAVVLVPRGRPTLTAQGLGFAVFLCRAIPGLLTGLLT